MFFSSGMTRDRILHKMAGYYKVPYVVAGSFVYGSGFGSDTAGTGDIEISQQAGYYSLKAETLQNDKYRLLVLSPIYDFTQIDKIFVTFACAAGSVGSKYFTIGACSYDATTLNANPDISLLTEHGPAKVKQATARTSTKAVESQIIDVSGLIGNGHIFFEIYAYSDVGPDSSELKVYSVVLEA